MGLHPVLFSAASDQDTLLKNKIEGLQWITPKQFGVPNADLVYKPELWQLATNKIKQIKYTKTPADKQ